MQLTESQLQLLVNVVSALIGAGSSIIIQWLAKKRTPIEEKNQTTDTQTQAAAKNVATAIEVNNMLTGLLEKQRNYFDEQLEESRRACHQQIETMRDNISEEYNDIINKMKDEQRRVTDELTRKVIELRAKLSKYEVESVTGKHEAITMANSPSVSVTPIVPPGSDVKEEK